MGGHAPQVHLLVLPAGEELVQGGVGGQAPKLFGVSLEGDGGSAGPRGPGLSARAIPAEAITCTSREKPADKDPWSTELRVVPTKSESPFPSAMVRTGPKPSGTCRE